jgi:hypothetical protein
MKAASPQVRAGDVYIHWSELGKTPYLYWTHNESNDINRLCELSKPWLKFDPILSIALSDKNFLENKNIEKFNAWWENYSEKWCEHWQIPSWSLVDQYSVIVVGHITQIDQVADLLKNQIYPIKIQL